MEGVDLTDLALFEHGFPHELFAMHRRVAPVWWHEPTRHTPGGEGFWSVAGHAEVLEVLHDPVTYSSEGGGDRTGGGTLLQDLDVAGLVLNMMDDPRHGRIRRLVSTGLTPRRIARLEGELRRRTRLLLDALPSGSDASDAAGSEASDRARGDGVVVDIVATVASELPMQAICLLLGVAEGDRHDLWAAVEAGFDVREGDAGFGQVGDVDTAEHQAQGRLLEYGAELIEAKRADPGDDLLSVVVHATLPDEDPDRLTELELWSFFALLFAAGSETTRNAIAGGLAALADHPDQLAALRADRSLLPSAIEEALRWTTPSPSKRRTATRAATLGGQAVAPGDKVLVWEGSANRDEAAFERADVFDIARSPNPHLAFGHGVHHCLGASLARLELRVVLGELLDRYERIEPGGLPEWTRSNRHTGLRRMPLRLVAHQDTSPS
jgi:cytochrome P450